jgi:hypothetical protein
MHNFIRNLIDNTSFPAGAVMTGNQKKILSEKLLDAIESKEFAELYAQRTGSELPPQGACVLGTNLIEKWSNIMSALTLAMTAAIATLQTDLGATAPTADQIATQVHTIVDPEIATLNTQLAAIAASESDDAAKIADVTAAVTAFTTAFAPAATPAATTTLPSGAAVPAAGTGTGGAAA